MTRQKKTLLTGGSGLLGRALLSLDSSLVAPPHAELDIASPPSVARAFERYAPDVVIHAAAMTSSHEVDAKRAEAIAANIIGTANIAVACLQSGARLVYISTDYLYAGAGPHTEDEAVKPANHYTWTKLGGECAVMLAPNALIIRGTFSARPSPYERAAEDKITSKLYIDEYAPEVLALAASDLVGVVNVGGPPRSMYDFARESRPDVRPVKLASLNEPIPPDTSLDLARWKNFKRDRSR